MTGSVSADGRTLAFSRNQSGTLGKLCTLEISTDLTARGEPNCFAISDQRLAHIGSISWIADSRELMFSSLFRGSSQASLWTIALPQGAGAVAVPQRVPVPSNNARDPAISRNGQRLACSDFLVDAGVWRLDLQNRRAGPTRLIASTRFDHGAHYSPDGKRIVFVSRRSGRPELWVASSDGSNQTQLTMMEAPLIGMPHWSPDSRRIVFDSTLDGQFELYAVNADGSGLRRLTQHPAADTVGSWSHDGRWIYFVSTRSGEHQIWKMPSDGGEPIPITRRGGEGASFESPDGKFVYYTRSIGSSTGASTLWRTPVNGGEEVKILDSLFRLQWTVAASGIYFSAPTDSGSVHASSIRFLSFRTGKISTIAPREWGGPPGITVSPDGRFLLYSFAQLMGSDLMLVEHFR